MVFLKTKSQSLIKARHNHPLKFSTTEINNRIKTELIQMLFALKILDWYALKNE